MYVTHISTFAVTILSTLDIKKKNSDCLSQAVQTFRKHSPVRLHFSSGQETREPQLQCSISCCEGVTEKGTPQLSPLKLNEFLATSKPLENGIQLMLAQVILPAVTPMRTKSINFYYKLNVNYFSISMKFTPFCVKKKKKNSLHKPTVRQ